MKKLKLLFIYTDWSNNEYRLKNKQYGGVSYYRVFKPAQYLRKWFDVDVMGPEIKELSTGKDPIQFYNEFLEPYDAVMTKQIDNPQAAATLAFFCEHKKIPLFVDLDDNYLTVRKDQPGSKYYYAGSDHAAYLVSYISFAKALFVSTEPLKKAYYDKLKQNYKQDKPIFVLPNFNDLKDWDFPKQEKPDVFTIGYAGSITHNADLESVMDGVNKFMTEFPETRFEIVGAVGNDNADLLKKHLTEDVQKRIQPKPGTPAWDKYPELLMSQRWSVGIAPLIDDEFNRGKSHIKWFEYTMLGVPIIASAVKPFTDNITDGKDGLLVKNSEEMYLALKRLYLDEKLRNQLYKNALSNIKKNHQYKDQVTRWKEAISAQIK